MPRKNKKKIVEDLDHAFEFTLILTNITTTALALGVSNIPQGLRGPLAFYSYILPAILAIVAWISIYLTDDKTWKMQLRTYSWSSVIILACLEFLHVFIAVFSWFYVFTLLFPFIPWVILTRILKRYKKGVGNIYFFTDSGLLGVLRRYMPFLLSWATFWAATLLNSHMHW